MEVARIFPSEKKQKSTIINMLARIWGCDRGAGGEQLNICFSPREVKTEGRGLTSDFLRVFISDLQILAKPLPETDSSAWVSRE